MPKFPSTPLESYGRRRRAKKIDFRNLLLRMVANTGPFKDLTPEETKGMKFFFKMNAKNAILSLYGPLSDNLISKYLHTCR